MFNVQCAMCNDETEGVVKLEKLLKKCIDIFFDMSEKGYPKDLTDGVLRLIIDLRNDLEKQKKPYIKRVAGYVCKGEDYSTRDEHGRFTGSVPHGSESSSGGGSVRHKYINRVIKKYFKMKGWDYGLV